MFSELFSFLKGKKRNIEILEDKIWNTTENKFKGILKEVKLLVDDNYFVCIVAHFSKTLDEIEKNLLKSDIKFFKGDLIDFNSIQLEKNGIKLALFLADDFQVNFTSTDIIDKNLNFIIIEHHLLFDNDEALLKSIENRFVGSKACFYISLEDVLFKPFASDRLKDLLNNLGLKEDCISSQMVSNAIRIAQDRIKAKSTSNLKAISPEHWLMSNCPAYDK